jgi:hypothetical protein
MLELIGRMRRLLDEMDQYTDDGPRIRGMHDLLLAMEERARTIRTEVSYWTPGSEHLDRLWEEA